MHIHAQNKNTILSPHIQVECETLGVSTIALIDRGADANTISHDLWVHLAYTTSDSNRLFGASNNHAR